MLDWPEEMIVTFYEEAVSKELKTSKEIVKYIMNRGKGWLNPLTVIDYVDRKMHEHTNSKSTKDCRRN